MAQRLGGGFSTQGFQAAQSLDSGAFYIPTANASMVINSPKITYSTGTTAGTKSYSASGLMNA